MQSLGKVRDMKFWEKWLQPRKALVQRIEQLERELVQRKAKSTVIEEACQRDVAYAQLSMKHFKEEAEAQVAMYAEELRDLAMAHGQRFHKESTIADAAEKWLRRRTEASIYVAAGIATGGAIKLERLVR